MKKIIKLGFSITILLIIALNIYDHQNHITYPVDPKCVSRWDKNSYWHSNWGSSTVHKGIDIFGDLNTKIISPVSGIVIDSGFNGNGGIYLYIISYDLKIYYFAHLSKNLVETFSYIKEGNIIGLMGDTGNARFSPFHLHFSIFSICPIFKYYRNKSPMGWKQIFYLNPVNYM